MSPITVKIPHPRRSRLPSSRPSHATPTTNLPVPLSQTPPKPRPDRSPTVPSFLLPFSHQPPPAQQQQRPRTPDPWRWRCCGCGASYNLACGRRCLACRHVLCTTGDRKGRMCHAEFDYEGWAEYGVWKRGLQKEKMKEKKARQRSLVAGIGTDEEVGRGGAGEGGASSGGCFAGCDWPSQCRHRAMGMLAPPGSGVGALEQEEEEEEVAEVDHVEMAFHIWEDDDDEDDEDEDVGDDEDDVIIVWWDGPGSVDPRKLTLGGPGDDWSQTRQAWEDWDEDEGDEDEDEDGENIMSGGSEV